MLLLIPPALPRCSLEAPSTHLTPLSFYSAGYTSRSNFKSPAPILHLFPLGIDTPQLSITQRAPHDIDTHQLPISLRRRCHLLAAIFTMNDVSILRRLSRRPLPWLMVVFQLPWISFRLSYIFFSHPFFLFFSFLPFNRRPAWPDHHA